MSASGPIPNRPHGLVLRWRWLAWLVTVVAAGVIGWLIHGNRTMARTVTVLTAPATVYQDTQAGLAAAAEQYFAQDATSCSAGRHCPPPNAWSLGPDGGGEWALGYTILSYTGRAAIVQAWQLTISSGRGGTSVNGSPPASSLIWGTTSVHFVWNGTRWQQKGYPATTVSGPTPPPDGTTGAASESFASEIASYWRFPGGP